MIILIVTIQLNLDESTEQNVQFALRKLGCDMRYLIAPILPAQIAPIRGYIKLNTVRSVDEKRPATKTWERQW